MSVINNMDVLVTEGFGVNNDDFDNIKEQKINTCRSCLAGLSTERGVNLFQNSHEEIPLTEIYELLLSSSQVKVNEDDGLPSKLCILCAAFVMQYYAFRKRALDSEIILQTVCKDQVHVENSFAEGNVCKIEIVVESDTEIKQEAVEPYECYEQDFDHNYSKRNDLCEMPELPKDAKIDVDTRKKVKKKEKPKTKQKACVASKTDINIPCPCCKNIFPTYQEYVVHRKREWDKQRKKVPCKYCNKLLKSNKLKDHVNTHTKEQPYVCDICGARFSISSSFYRHKYRHSDKKPLECKECGKGFIQAAFLADHIRKHTGERLICDICGMEYAIKRAFDEHVRMHNASEEITDPSKNEMVECNICGQNVSTPRLKLHVYRHHGKKVLCSICGQSFPNKGLLNKHSKNRHSNIKPHVCKICGKAFKQKAQLETHNITHTGEKPLLCVICGRRFSYKTQFDHHMRTHTGERPYACNFCQRTFSRPDYLKNHMRTHTGEKPFVCDICSKAYRYSDSLKKHKKTHEMETGLNNE